MLPYYNNPNFKLFLGDCCEILPSITNVNCAFIDPPYFLSNNGLTIENGEIVSVNKGDWDKPTVNIDDFNYKWINLLRNCLAPNGTLWICGTMHNIYSIVKVLQELNFKLLNTITWQKRNPPPNFSCRYFTHSTEFIIWARKSEKKPHYYNYELMKALNGNKQMKDVWDLPSIARWEKNNGKHPTQKPLSVVCRALLASTRKGDLILDPFCGSSTTGIAAHALDRKYIGIDIEQNYLNISIKRYDEIKSNPYLIKKIYGLDFNIINELDK